MTLKRWGPIFMILSLVAAVAIPAIADYLGPNRTVTTYVWKRLHCRYQAIYDPPGAGWYGCYLHLYQTPDSTCPSADSVVTFFNPKDCSWPSDFCQDPGCSITLSSSKEECSEGQTGCRATETTVTHPPATVSGSVTCNIPGSNGWCRGGAELSLSGTEPLDGYSILALEGTRNGETFACTGTSCSVPLVEGANDFTFWALSSWGDSSLKGTTNGKLDSSPPVISGELSGTAGEGGWYVSEVSIAASVNDAVSGVVTFETALDGGGWAAYGGPIALADGDHVVDLRAVDAAGNISSQSQAVRVDTQPPSLTLDANASFCPGCGETLGIAVDIQDNGSGVTDWSLSANGVTIKDSMGPSSETLTWNGSGLAAGAHTLLLQAQDAAGNSSEASQGVTLVAPTQPPPPPPTKAPSRPKEDAPEATAVPTTTPTSSSSAIGEASPTPTHTADHKPTRTPSTFIFGGPPAAPPDEVSGEGLTGPDSAPGQSLTGSGSAPGENLTVPESSAEGGSSNVLWGAGATALIAAATAVALEATRRRKEAEAREREEMVRRNAQAEAREEAERQRLAALAAARQKIAQRLEKYEAMRQEIARRKEEIEAARLETLAEREEAKHQHMSALNSARQTMLNAIAAATTAVTAAAEARRREKALQRRIEHNLGMQSAATQQASGQMEEDRSWWQKAWDDAKCVVQEKIVQPVQQAWDGAKDVVQEKIVQPVQQAWDGAKSFVQEKIVQPVQQAVPKVMDWVDQHQREIALGVGVAAGVAAIVLSGGAATPLVAAAWTLGSAAVAGGVIAAGTVGLNAYYQRPLTTNLPANIGIAAGAAVVTSGLGFALTGGVVQQGLYSLGNAASRLCLAHPTGCARVGAALTLWDKVEDIGLQAKLAIQTAQGDPRAADTALELQLERLDNTPGNTTFREIYENAVTLFSRHSDEAAQIASVAVRHGDDILDTFDDGMIRARPEVAEGIAGELEEATGGKVWFSASSGTIYVSNSSHRGLDAVAQLEMALRIGADEETIGRLVDEVAMASTRGNGSRIILGAWKEGGGYIGQALENDGIFFDTGNEVWDELKKIDIDPWQVNEAFLRRQLESGVERVDFVGESIEGLFSAYDDIPFSELPAYRLKEIFWLEGNAGTYGYSRVGNSWIRK